MRRLSVLALVLLSTSCGSITEIVLVVDTDIAEADSLRVTAVHPDGRSDSAKADLSTSAPPRTLVLWHRGGALGPVHLTIEAMRGDAPLVSVVREVAFHEGRSLRLEVFLADGCSAVSCNVGETCGNDGQCRSPVVPACDYEGSCVPPDAGGCVAYDGALCALMRARDVAPRRAEGEPS